MLRALVLGVLAPGGLVLGGLALAGCEGARSSPRGNSVTERPAEQPRATTTQGADALRQVEARRAQYREALSAAPSGAARHRVVREAARYLEDLLIDAVLPRWDGTPWSFSGTSTTPRTGSIACGYFVSTTLKEAGIRVERARLAQQASEDIIKTLAPSEAIQRFSDVPVEKFTAAVAARGDGLYVVGLDNHVGFLIARGGKVLFHHSSYVGATAVVREEAATSSPLAESRYRVIGKLFTEDALVEAWIQGTPVPTKVRSRR
ncbi:MAG: hypothetical protein R3B70_19205 [Polyangiaceae bacterium]